jgi:hypothetical protein
MDHRGFDQPHDLFENAALLFQGVDLIGQLIEQRITGRAVRLIALALGVRRAKPARGTQGHGGDQQDGQEQLPSQSCRCLRRESRKSARHHGFQLS